VSSIALSHSFFVYFSQSLHTHTHTHTHKPGKGKPRETTMAGRSTGTSATTEAKLYSVELGQHRCIAILRECLARKDGQGQTLIQFDFATGCTLFTGKTTGDGHWQIQRQPRYILRESRRTSASGSNKHRAYYVHRIAYVALHGQDIAQTGSHLCGNANCFNPYHIRDESQHDNNSRQRCLGFVICPEHNHVLAKLCQHDPPCIKPPVQATQCCLTASRGVTIPDSQESSPEPPTPIISLPPIQRIQDFLDAQPNIPESQFVNTSEESADELMESSSSSSNSDGLLPDAPSQVESTIVDAEFASSSQGPSYGSGGG
jgi:hypothetical protein